ncbi:MAG TPA: hypothetical protein VGD49_01960 [Longimicrobiales bacterium]
MVRLKTAPLLAVLLSFSACVDATAPIEARYGRYALHRINGDMLPQQMVENSVYRLEFLSGAVRLNSNGTFTDSTQLRVTSFQGPSTVSLSTDVAAGTYRIAGDTVFYSSTRGESYRMTFQTENSMLQELNGSILHYRR